MGQRLLLILAVLAPTLAGAISGFAEWINLSFARGVLYSVCLLGLLLFIAAYRLQNQIDDMRDSVPRLVYTGTSYDTVPIRNLATGAIYGIPTFYHVGVANKPRGQIDKQVAKMVAGMVEILSADKAQVCPPKLHRWRHSAGPAEVGKSADILQSQDIQPNEIEVLLDIAMKYDDEDEFYTPTNDTVVKGYRGWRDDRYRFAKGEYIARIRLVGSNVDRVIKCNIVNRGKGARLQIAQCAASSI